MGTLSRIPGEDAGGREESEGGESRERERKGGEEKPSPKGKGRKGKRGLEVKEGTESGRRELRKLNPGFFYKKK